jgi:hypothetical protein
MSAPHRRSSRSICRWRGQLLAAMGALAFVCAQAGTPATPAFTPRDHDALQHAPSGMVFPAVCGEFVRAATRDYDATGRDISVGYNLTVAAVPIAATVYVYPSPPVRSVGSPRRVTGTAKQQLAAAEFERAKREIMQAHEATVLLAEDRTERPNGGEVAPVWFAKFTYLEFFAGRVQPVESLLYVRCYASDEWTIKYRVTYPVGVEAAPMIAGLIGDLRRATEQAANASTVAASAR